MVDSRPAVPGVDGPIETIASLDTLRNAPACRVHDDIISPPPRSHCPQRPGAHDGAFLHVIRTGEDDVDRGQGRHAREQTPCLVPPQPSSSCCRSRPRLGRPGHVFADQHASTTRHSAEHVLPKAMARSATSHGRSQPTRRWDMLPVVRADQHYANYRKQTLRSPSTRWPAAGTVDGAEAQSVSSSDARPAPLGGGDGGSELSCSTFLPHALDIPDKARVLVVDAVSEAPAGESDSRSTFAPVGRDIRPCLRRPQPTLLRAEGLARETNATCTRGAKSVVVAARETQIRNNQLGRTVTSATTADSRRCCWAEHCERRLFRIAPCAISASAESRNGA